MLITISEIMDLLGVSRYTATKMLRSYLGKGRKKGHRYLVSKENFMLWVNNGGFKG